MRIVNPGSKNSRSTGLQSLVVLASVLLIAAACFGQLDQVQTLTVSRTPVTGPPPVQESFIATSTPSPVAVVILLPGATGNIQLTPLVLPDGSIDVTSTNGRNRWLYAGHNFYTITLDAATDFLQLPNVLKGYEGSAAHITDVLTVISWARATVPGVPVYIVGISRGTAGAFVAGQYTPAEGGPDGLVLASSINDTTDVDSVLMADLAGITVPVLLINDKGNTCTGTLASGEMAVKKALKLSPLVALKLIPSGGLTALTSNCEGLSDHAFFGAEDQLVKEIALWISSLPAAPTKSANSRRSPIR